ncbi:MAG: hypothetical protein SVM79_00100 [Chloroflexota bacterium]|nr:hypothetical protein [Chloroflexota bacterium]
MKPIVKIDINELARLASINAENDGVIIADEDGCLNWINHIQADTGDREHILEVGIESGHDMDDFEVTF